MGDALEVTVSKGVITLKKARHYKTLEERLAEFGEISMFDEEFDWGEPVGDEVL